MRWIKRNPGWARVGIVVILLAWFGTGQWIGLTNFVDDYTPWGLVLITTAFVSALAGAGAVGVIAACCAVGEWVGDGFKEQRILTEQVERKAGQLAIIEAQGGELSYPKK